MPPTDTSSSTSSIRSRPTRPVSTVVKAGRTYYNRADVSVPYPLPVDLVETHRQILFAQLTSLVYDTPVLSRDVLSKPPLRVLELGCGTGWWSATCHQFFKARGHDVEFVGIDIKPLPGSTGGGVGGGGSNSNNSSDTGVADFRWEYVQHDLNQFPWPVPDGAFDLVMARNIALALDGRRYSDTVQEYVRVLRPGGTLELWEHDVTIRALRAPSPTPEVRRGSGSQHAAAAAAAVAADLAKLGLYSAADNASFRPAANPYAAQYNTWLTAALADLELPTMPCSYIDAMFRGHLVDGSEDLETENMTVKRVAIPLCAGPMSWEQQQQQQQRGGSVALGPDQEVIRRTALESFVGMVEAFGPLLQEKSGLSIQADWDAWLGKAKRDWLEGGGFVFGECVELGVWSLKKKAR